MDKGYWRADDCSAHIDDSLANGDMMNTPIIKQLGGPGTTVTNFNQQTGTMDFVRGTTHFTLEAGELAFLLAHLYDLRSDIYEVRNLTFERTLHLVK